MNWPLWFHLQVVESNSIFCLKMHKEMIFNLKSVSQQWKKKLSSGSHIVLGKYFNFYFYLEKAELIGIILWFIYLFSKFLILRVIENILVMLISKWKLTSVNWYWGEVQVSPGQWSATLGLDVLPGVEFKDHCHIYVCLWWNLS